MENTPLSCSERFAKASIYRSHRLRALPVVAAQGAALGVTIPDTQDQCLLIGRTVELIGRLQADARVFENSCSALIDVERIDGWRHRGLTEVVLRPCPNPPQQGWQLKLTGALQAPQSSVHALVLEPAGV